MAWNTREPFWRKALQDSFIRWVEHNHPEEIQRWKGYERIRNKFKTKAMRETKVELDHLTPIAEGGHWSSDNIVITTKEFNRKKGKKELHPAIVKWLKGEE